MKDLDFDELDRAVNSLLGAPSTPVDQKETVASEPVNPAVVESSPQPADVSTSPTQPLAARRSTGRFMDVVHPSSDMRSATIPQRPVSREGVNIASSVTSRPVDAPVNSWASPSAPVVEPEVVESEKPTSNEWPDPIDFTGYTPDVKSEDLAEPVNDTQPESDLSVVDEDKDINQIADAINQTLSQGLESQAPLESPFLTDAKVEKRPLGAFSMDVPVPEVVPSPDEAPVVLAEPDLAIVEESTEADAPVAADLPTQIDTPLPAELQDELLSIEADGGTSNQPETTEPVAVPLQPVQATDVAAGPTSITQQYTEQPSTGDQPTGAIFDTDAYKKPLNHPAKKKSGWLFVLWIVLLLAVGAGAGALVFFFVLPML